MALVDTLILEPDTYARISRFGLFGGVIAEDPETGVRLRVGSGRRRRGAPRRYFIHAPACLLPAGYFDQVQVGTVTAYDDATAIERANARMAREV